MSDLLHKKFIRNKNLPWQSSSEETVIIDPKGENSFELNEVGSVIWNSIDGENSILNIREKVCTAFNVCEQVVTDDLVAVMTQLLKKNFIQERS